MRRLALILFLPLTACGLQWEGTYEGTVDSTLSCYGDTQRGSGKLEVTVTELDARTIEFDEGDDCPMTLAIKGDEARFSSTICPTESSRNGGTVGATVTGGSVTLEGDELKFERDITLYVTTADGRSGTCTMTEKGTLTRTSKD